MRNLSTIIGVVALLAFLPMGLEAQDQKRFRVDGHGGVVLPTGDLADSHDVGPTAGIGLAYRIHPRIALRADGAIDWLQTAELSNGVTTPDLRLWHYNAGVEFDMLPQRIEHWSLTTNVGAGATTFDMDELQLMGETGADFSETYFSVNGGAEVGYNVNRYLEFFLGAQTNVMFADEQDTAFLNDVGSELDGFGTVVSLPIYAGASFSFRTTR